MLPQAENTFRPNRLGNFNESPIININPKYGRLYFSVFAVRALDLDAGAFVIIKRGTRWLLSKTTNRNDFVLKFHERSYYIVAKRLVFRLANDFQHERPSFFIERVNQKRKYHTLRFFAPDPATIRPSRPPRISPPMPKKDPKIVSAERIMDKFEKSNFDGRVKTKEILRAEQILNRS